MLSALGFGQMRRKEASPTSSWLYFGVWTHLGILKTSDVSTV
jgi:hypothetical protein